jgi:hypothetical protein
MARIDWALACALAFFDREDRLCVVGVTERLAVPHLPLAIDELMLVAKIVGLNPADDIDVEVRVIAPSGLWTRPAGEGGVAIEVAGEYVLITLRGLPLVEAGVHGFQISLSGQAPASIALPVSTVATALHA